MKEDCLYVNTLSAVMTYEEIDEHVSTMNTWIRYVKQKTDYYDEVREKDCVNKG